MFFYSFTNTENGEAKITNNANTKSSSMKYLLGALLIVVAAGRVIARSSISLTTLRPFALELHLADLLKSHRLHHEMNREDETPAVAKELISKFRVGDIVEQIYNQYTVKNRVLYPFQVEEMHEVSDEQDCTTDITLNDNCDSIRYTIIRLVDGHRVKRAPESSLRQYLPYEIDTMAACNVGGYGKDQTLAPCFIQEYIPSSNEYRVRIEGEEMEQNFPVDKLQRHA